VGGASFIGGGVLVMKREALDRKKIQQAKGVGNGFKTRERGTGDRNFFLEKKKKKRALPRGLQKKRKHKPATDQG